MGMPSAPAPGMTGKDFVRILRKRKWMIILSLAICSILSAVSTAVWMFTAPFYTAEAYLEVVPPQNTPLQAATPIYGKEVMDRLTMSMAQMVKSDSVIGAACSAQNVKATEWYRNTPETEQIQYLVNKLAVGPVPGTSFIRIALSGTNKQDLPEIVNAVAEAFVTDTKEMVGGDRLNQINQLLEERKNLQARLDQLRVEENRTRGDLPTLQEQRNAMTFRLQSLVQRLTELEVAQAQARDGLRILQEREQQGGLENSPEVQIQLTNDPNLRSLDATRINLATELEDALRKLGPKHRIVQATQNRLASLNSQIKARQDELVTLAVQGLKQQQEAQLANITAQLLEVRQKYNEIDSRSKDIQANLSQLEQMQNDDKVLDDRIRKYDDRLGELRVLSRGEHSIIIRRNAVLPREPSMPQWKIMIPLGVVLGLVIGLGLAFLLEFVDTSVKGPSDITRRVELPLLGMIPHAEDLEEEIEDPRRAFSTHPNSLIGEAFRQIRTCLLFSGPANQRRSLLITSPLPEDGRTTVTINLAAAIARGGRKVLVLDANFRHSMLRTIFPQCGDGGLSSALVGQAHWRDLVREVEPNLYVMPSGPMPPNPAELLGSESMRQLIAELVAQYDQVLFDGPPCLVVTDATVLSTLVDGVVLAVRANSNTYGIVQRCRDVLSKVGAHIVGVALNGVRTTVGGYLQKNYETFYEYHSQLPSNGDGKVESEKVEQVPEKIA
jgi:capsular exopolysaccharide synthesis family protein